MPEKKKSESFLVDLKWALRILSQRAREISHFGVRSSKVNVKLLHLGDANKHFNFCEEPINR